MGANQTWAKVIGVILLLAGVLGFFSGDMLLGIFSVNTLHNIVHLVAGLILVWAGFAAAGPAKKANQWIGVIVLLLGIIGFFALRDLLALNSADNWLHIVVGLVLAFAGFKSD